MDVEGENAKLLLPGFEQHSGRRVTLQWLPWTAAHQKMLTAFAGDGLPDVLMLSSQWTAEFLQIGAVRTLPAALQARMPDVFPAALDLASVNGAAVALPWDIDVSVQYFRRDRLAEAGYEAPPAAWEAWRSCLRAIKKRRPEQFAILMQLNWPDHLIGLAVQQPESLLRDRQSRGNFRSEGFKAVLAFYASLFEEGLAPKVSSVEADDPVGELARGYVAIYPAGSWIRAELLRRTAELASDAWSVAPLPGIVGPGSTVLTCANLAVARETRDATGAAALIDYLTKVETQARFFQVAGVLPSRPSAWRTPVLAGDSRLPVFAEAIGRAKALPNAPEWPRIIAEIQLIAERLVRGQLTLAAAAAEMDRTADALLAKRRWLLDKGRIA